MIPGSESATTEERGERRPRNWDFLLSTLLIVMLIGQRILFVVLGFTFGPQVLCARIGADCNDPVITWSARLVVFGTPLITVAAIVITILRIVRRKLAWSIGWRRAPVLRVFVVSNWLVRRGRTGRSQPVRREFVAHLVAGGDEHLAGGLHASGVPAAMALTTCSWIETVPSESENGKKSFSRTPTASSTMPRMVANIGLPHSATRVAWNSISASRTTAGRRAPSPASSG